MSIYTTIMIIGRASTIIKMSVQSYLKGLISLDHIALLVGLISNEFLLQNVCHLFLEKGQSVPQCKSGITIKNKKIVLC